jgi:hypothetical protein
LFPRLEDVAEMDWRQIQEVNAQMFRRILFPFWFGDFAKRGEGKRSQHFGESRRLAKYLSPIKHGIQMRRE